MMIFQRDSHCCLYCLKLDVRGFSLQKYSFFRSQSIESNDKLTSNGIFLVETPENQNLRFLLYAPRIFLGFLQFCKNHCNFANG